MTKRRDAQDETATSIAPELRERLHAMVDVIVDQQTADGAGAGLEGLAESARQLLSRKLSMQGTKSATRTHLESLLAKRLEAVFDGVTGSGGCEPLATEILLGTLVSGSLLSDFADAVDRVILQGSGPIEYSLAGRADFISLEEVLQLLGGGKHRGCLTVEKPDNRLDIYLDNSAIAYLNPHRLLRRVLPNPDRMTFREISSELLAKAEEKHANEQQPLFVTLQEERFFRESEVRDQMRQLGSEVLYEFLREQQECAYTYRRLDQLPDYAVQHNLKIPVTPLLLEGNKQRDDWRSLAKVFPDPAAPLQPVDDIIGRIGSLDLGVLEIKMLAQIGHKASPRDLVNAMGLPLHEIYHHLVRFAKVGVLVPPNGSEVLDDLAMSIEESVEMAWQALDANDDDMAVSSALDKVLGGFGDDYLGGGNGSKKSGSESKLGPPRLRALVDGEEPDSEDDDEEEDDDDR